LTLLFAAEQFRQFAAQRRSDVVALQRIGDVGGEESDLGPAVEAAALELQTVKGLRLRKLHHRVRKLDFAARAGRLFRQHLENLRLQDVAPGDAEVGWRFGRLRLFDHLRDREGLAFGRPDADDAIHVHAVGRHFFHRDDVGVVFELGCGVDHLRDAAARILHQHVRQQQRERLIADQFACAPHRMTETERRLLAGETGGAWVRQVLRQQRKVVRLSAFAQGHFELELAVEVILDHALVATGDEYQVLNAGLPRLIHHMLDKRAVHDREHFLRHGFGRRKEPGSEPGDWKNGFADAAHAGFLLLAALTPSPATRKHGPRPRVQMQVRHRPSLTPSKRYRGTHRIRLWGTDRRVTMAGSGKVFGGLLIAALAAGAYGVALAQSARIARNADFPTGAISTTPDRDQGPSWSGASGASGDESMTAEAIRAAAVNFPNCIEQLWPAAARRGISRAAFQTYTARLTPDLRIMDLLDAQPEFT